MCQFKHDVIVENPNEKEIVEESHEREKEIFFPCTLCGFISKTEAYLGVHIASTHVSTASATDNGTDDDDENYDDEVLWTVTTAI